MFYTKHETLMLYFCCVIHEMDYNDCIEYFPDRDQVSLKNKFHSKMKTNGDKDKHNSLLESCFSEKIPDWK